MTQHVHFDIEPVIDRVRKMYASCPDTSFAADPAISAVVRRSVECEVALTRFTFEEINRGTDIGVLLEALVTIFTNLILNRMGSFNTDDPNVPPVVLYFIEKLIPELLDGWETRNDNGPSGHSVEVRAVDHGTA